MDIEMSAAVAAAVADGRPVVALESTVISHGLPRPKNLETAISVERMVREGGAVPATTAFFGGRLCVGLDTAQIERLAAGTDVRKISRRDVPIAVAKKLTGATTVATTAMVAHRAGIKVFATGGIGGVHRGFAADVSADLVELSRTPIVVVCSGPKAILDLAATREWLETYGITVLGWRCDEMPAFYSVSSGLAVDERVETAGDVAEIAAARDDLGISNAVLVTVPPPPECAIDGAELEGLLTEAIAFAGSSAIKGKELTPFLLAHLAGLSEGRTLAANIALLENNARIAAAIAAAVADRS